jgi:very-short-patch-repair endonuclease
MATWVPPVASAQEGVFTRSQAMAAGLTRAQVEYRLKVGVFKPVAGKALALADQPIGIEQGAYAMALTWPDAVLWGSSALRLWSRSSPLPKSEVLLCAVPHARKPQFRLEPRRIEIPSVEQTLWKQVPCQAQLPALADSLRLLTEAEADRLLAWAITRDEAPPEEMAAIFAKRHGMRGAATLRRALPLITSEAASLAELLAQAIFRRAGIKGWKPDVRIEFPDGSFIKVDFYFKVHRLIVEIDGFEYHGDRQAFQKDRDRQNALVAQIGERILRFTWKDLTEREDYVIDTVKQALR